MNDKERDDILKTLTRIVENHDKVIYGDDKLGIIGLMRKQEKEDKRNDLLIEEMRSLEGKMDSIHSDIKKEVEEKFKIIETIVEKFAKWKDGIQNSVTKYTSWAFWWRVIIFVIVAYTLATEGAPAAFKWLLELIKTV